MASSDLASSDLASFGRGGSDGFTVGVVAGRGGWHVRQLALIRPAGADDEWTGYTCLTGSGRHIVAVVAPRSASNKPAWHYRGASAYVVDVADGAVRPVVLGVALKYHSPGCGVNDDAVLTRYLGEEGDTTELLVVDTSTAQVTQTHTFAGQLTSAVPFEGKVAGAVGSNVVVTDGEAVETLATVRGQAYMLRPGVGGVDFLAADGRSTARVYRAERGRPPREQGSGALQNVRLFTGRDGRNVVVGGTPKAPSSGLHWLDAPPLAAVGASLDGATALSLPAVSTAAADAAAPIVVVTDVDGADVALLEGESLPGTVTEALPPSVRALAGGVATATAAASTATWTTPKCGVPRNDLRRQVVQPNRTMVDWAVQQATRNLLKGSVLTRPANYAHMGLVSYQPSNDFPRRELKGWAGAPVPRSVIEAVFAQESAWKHASRRVLPGLSGNPTIGDYYGAGGTLDTIDYSDADCGYGLSQVTDCMSAVATCYTANGKAKVAVDYAENVAAGIQVLVDKWNQLWDANVKLNNADPQHVENWYFALWAYNSGFHPFVSTSQPWGLGWTNNPQNADYCPCRTPFLRATYADAETPASWPYQERVLGWVETPIRDYKGNQAYATTLPDGRVVIPAYSTFCNDSATGNECSTTHRDPVDPNRDYCKRSDRKCWWHTAVTYAACPGACETSPFTVSTTAAEPANDDNHPPNCSLTANGTEEDPDPARSPIIVDNQPAPLLNMEGCSPSSNWTSNGTFTVVHGQNDAGAPLGVIDWHQLGSGFGGHFWFTKNRASTDTAHVNVGTWTPSSLSDGVYNVRVHVPRTGASTARARYTVHLGNGSTAVRVVDQHLHENRWVSLGTFLLSPGAKVVLTNETPEGPGTANVAFDAVAFVPVSGTVVTKTFDAVGVFDENQDLDVDVGTAPPWADTTVLESMQRTYRWARGRVLGDDQAGTVGVLDFPVCVLASTTSCVGSKTHEAFSRWGTRVLVADDRPRTPQAPDTQARWLNFSNPDPPLVVDDAWIDNPDNWKTRTRITASYLVSGGAVDRESLYIGVERKAGNTHLPEFVMDVMRAYRDDYGVALPNLTYTAKDLREHTHATTTVNPAVTGIAPGRAYFGYSPAPTFTDGDECVRVRSIGGGGLGLKPMVHSSSVRAAAADWVERVRDVVQAGQAPAVLGDMAEDIRKLFFKAASVNPAVLDMNSPFWVAPAVWVQADVAFCADDSVRPGNGSTLADNSYMPDLYLYLDGVLVDQNAVPTTRPVAVGDFARFSHPPSDYLPISITNPWDQCTFDESNPHYRNRRNGSPWPLSFTTTEDETPNAVRLCDDRYFPPDFHFDEP